MASDTSGVKPMALGGRMVRERERLTNMTAEERAWRKQYLKDLELSPREPVMPQDYYKVRFNPIRRAYRAPLEALQSALTPALGAYRAYFIRFWTGKVALGLAGLYAGVYYFKYNSNDWTRKGGWRVLSSRPVVNPGDQDFPKLSDRSAHSDYADRGFKQAPI